jgi:hypothetical protein
MPNFLEFRHIITSSGAVEVMAENSISMHWEIIY